MKITEKLFWISMSGVLVFVLLFLKFNMGHFVGGGCI